MAYESPYRTAHESFPQPAAGSIAVWRYLNLAKLIELLAGGKLILVRVDLLKDEYEGSVTRGVHEAWSNGPNAAAISRFRAEFRNQTYVSCWCAGDVESEAMWRLYCGADEGVALKTSYEKLDRAVPPFAWLGRVTYVDYSTSDRFVAEHNVFTPFMQKRRAFQHEQEVRIVVFPGMAKLEQLDWEPGTTFPETLGLDLDIASTIENVCVSPYAPEWYRDVVAAVLEKFAPALRDRLMWSNMKGVPLY